MNLVTSLMSGVAAIVVVFVSLYIMTPIKGARIAMIVAAITLGLYIPYAILNWSGGDVFSIHIGIYLITCYLLGIISSYRDKKKASGDDGGPWFHWAPASIIMFFIVIVSFDSFFVTVSQQGLSPEMAKWLLPEPKNQSTITQTNFPGVVERDYNLKNSDLQDYQKNLDKQRKLGWTVNRGWLNIDFPKVDQAAIFQITVVDKQQKPVSNANVEGKFLRLSDHTLDADFTMQEMGPGLYQVNTTLPAPGRWNVYLRIKQGENVYELQASTNVIE